MVTHGLLYITYILLYWLLLTGPHLGIFGQTSWPWMYRFGTLQVQLRFAVSYRSTRQMPLLIARPHILSDASPSFAARLADLGREPGFVTHHRDVSLGFLCATQILLPPPSPFASLYDPTSVLSDCGRMIEESTQLRLQSLRSYFASTWNCLDVTTLLMMTVCLVLRVLVWIDGAAGRYSIPGNLGFSSDALRQLAQMIQCLFAVSAVLVLLRFLETLSYSNAMGELLKVTPIPIRTPERHKLLAHYAHSASCIRRKSPTSAKTASPQAQSSHHTPLNTRCQTIFRLCSIHSCFLLSRCFGRW